MTDIKTAAQALVDKLDEISPLINNINVRKENLHNPIDFRDEVKALKTALERDKAMDELIADGQSRGDYDSDVVSALIPFAYWYALNDCDDSTKSHIEVPIEDLRRAYNAIGDEKTCDRNLCDRHAFHVANDTDYCRDHFIMWNEYLASERGYDVLHNITPLPPKE